MGVRGYLAVVVVVAAAGVVVTGSTAAVGAGSTVAAVRTVRVSVSTSGAQGDGYADEPALSGDGRFVAFESGSTNVVAQDTNGADDIFLRDRQRGVTSRISVSSTGAQSNMSSARPAISADGRYVVYSSSASNLVAGDTNNAEDVFMRDTVRHVTSRISVSSSGVQGNQDSAWPEISADGRYVVYSSSASNLAPGDTNHTTDVFIRDTVSHTTTLLSVSSTGVQSAGQNENPVISADGRYVAFWSAASNLVPGDTNNDFDVFVRDRQTATTTRVSVSNTGAQGVGGLNGSDNPAISADGRYIAFESDAINLVPGDTNAVADVFLRDRLRGTTSRISVSTGSVQANAYSYQSNISSDGRYVAFGSAASNLVTGDTNTQQDVFVRDRQTATTTRVSVADSGAQANDESLSPMLSADGHYVGFMSFASNLVAGDTNGVTDIFLRNLR